MKLNKGKCELITIHQEADVHFGDGARVKKVKGASYLGCEIGMKGTAAQELNNRFANTMITMKKLDLFRRHSDCGTAVKIYTADAVLRAKLLYGLESAQLNDNLKRKIDVFQMKKIK